jgi:hypothetical protein
MSRGSLIDIRRDFRAGCSFDSSRSTDGGQSPKQSAASSACQECPNAWPSLRCAGRAIAFHNLAGEFPEHHKFQQGSGWFEFVEDEEQPH